MGAGRVQQQTLASGELLRELLLLLGSAGGGAPPMDIHGPRELQRDVSHPIRIAWPPCSHNPVGLDGGRFRLTKTPRFPTKLSSF